MAVPTSELQRALARLDELRTQASGFLTTGDIADPGLDGCCHELARLQRDLATALFDSERQRAETVSLLAGARRTVARMIAERRSHAGSDQRLAEAHAARIEAEARAEHLAHRLGGVADDEALIVIAESEPDAEGLIVIASDESVRPPAEARTAADARAPAESAPRVPAHEAIATALTWGQGGWHWCALADGLRNVHRLDATPATTATLPGAGGRADLLVLSDGIWSAWNDAEDQANLATPDGESVVLGSVRGRPALMRGCGELPVSVAWSAPDGEVRIQRPGDLCDRLNADHGGPPAAGAASSWWWDYEGSRHVVYRDADGGINEFLELDGVWYHAPLHRHTGCPPAAGDPVGYAPGDHEHVLFRAVDGHVHELCFEGRSWLDHDLTAACGAPPAAGQPAGAYIGGRHVVAYRGVDDRLHLLRLRRDWRFRTLDGLGPITGDPLLASSGGQGALAWPTASGWRWCVFAHEGSVEAASGLP